VLLNLVISLLTVFNTGIVTENTTRHQTGQTGAAT